jgi:hypothetical protein
MARIRDIAARDSFLADDAVAVSDTSQLDKTLEWFGYSETYAQSAERLSLHGRELYLPWQQLAGHALECALRGCLQSAGFDAPVPHNLIALFEQAESFGFQLRDSELVMIVLVSHAYSHEPDSGTRYVPRQPMPFGVITQYSSPPSLRLNLALRELRRQALLRLGICDAEA